MKKIEISDKQLFERYFDESIINSEYQFSTLYIWQHVYGFEYEIWNDTLLVYGKQTNGKLQVYYPLGGTYDLAAVLKHIKEVFHEVNETLNFRPLSEEMKDRLLEVLDCNIVVGEKESYYDYIYDFDSLRWFQGSDYKKKRHALHRFCSKYDYSYEAVTPNMRQELLREIERILKLDDSWNSEEYEAYWKLIMNYERLNVRGGVLRINGCIEAVAMGELVGNSMVLMHLRRCNKQFEGIYPAMLHEFLVDAFSSDNITIVNTQDDMGDPGVRKAKLSYHPIYRLKKYYISGVDDE